MRYEGDNMMDVKRTNRSAVMRILHEMGGMSRKRMAENIKLTPAAITKIVGELIEDGIVREGQALPSGGAGRREVLVELDLQAFCALGIHLNRRQAILSAVWLDGSVIFSEKQILPDFAPAEETVERLCARLMELTAEKGLEREKILGAGVAVRGATAADGESVRNSYGALDTKDYPLVRRVEELTGLPAVMANNVRALLAAQMFLARETELSSQFFLRCEDGIGAALSIDNQIWRGDNEQCSEIGHIPVILRGGKPCSCGKSGCLETIASPSAMREDALAILSEKRTPVLWKRMRGRDPASLHVEDVLEAARHGDAEVAAIVDRAVSSLAQALKAVIYVIDPAKIVLYGRLFESDYYLARLLSEMREGVDAGHTVPIEKSKYNGKLEESAAALLAVEAFYKNGGMME